ncbi:hypothetical protein Sru01_06860 [Sphaerisporangium rufum]|uniref:Uncharacterized protein n=1 Tax=Sphaerisporangium rufum TaxID=1381558 RepID=A0A919UXC9_9ACTN|nr:hypothetical protein [Sphaerisporangium rufum]GII75704.1 hypothetical protein Sru01_06860 [Sphaerisporangium rufum]
MTADDPAPSNRRRPAPAAAGEPALPEPDEAQARAAARPARFAVRLPGFLVEEEIGLGEVIKRATTSAGIRPCGGCGERAARLDRLVRFTPR